MSFSYLLPLRIQEVVFVNIVNLRLIKHLAGGGDHKGPVYPEVEERLC